MYYNRLMLYNWQQIDWPEFKYDLSDVEDGLFAFVNGLLKTYQKWSLKVGHFSSQFSLFRNPLFLFFL